MAHIEAHIDEYAAAWSCSTYFNACPVVAIQLHVKALVVTHSNFGNQGFQFDIESKFENLHAHKLEN